MATFGDQDRLRLKIVFEAARVLPAESRPAYLATACYGDPALRREVEELLASHESATTFLGRPVAPSAESLGTRSVSGLPHVQRQKRELAGGSAAPLPRAPVGVVTL